MSTTPTPQPESFQNVQVGTVVVPTQPDTVVFPLTLDKFDLLRMGDGDSDLKRYRDIALSCGITGLVGFFGFLPAADWNKSWSYVLCVGLLAIVLAAVAVYVFCWIWMTRSKGDSGYTRIKSEIENHFAAHRGS